MSQNCDNTRHPLLRDGSSQLQRLLKALLPSYVSVDERSLEDLIAFARKYAEEIYYYAPDNQANGNWVDFFQKAIDAEGHTEPHYALFTAFLDLFRVAQDDLNTITQRHLDFYYREVLGLQEKPAVPDQVYVVFELAKNTASTLLEKNAMLNAGKDATGKNLNYSLDSNFVPNRASVSELKAVFANKSADYRIYASPVANSSDGIGGKLTGDEQKWRTFGGIGSPADRLQPDLGFAVTSPVLRLAEGTRTVGLTLVFNNPVTIPAVLLAGRLRVLFSGEKDWIEPQPHPTSDVTISGNRITLNRVLPASLPAVVDYHSKLSGQALDATYPVAKVLLKADPNPYVYAMLKDLQLTSVIISAGAAGVKNLTLFNDQAKLKVNKTFEPFTSQPVVGSSFYVGSAEVFSKQLQSVSLNITWHGLPNVAFSSYYHDYLNNTNRTNSGFRTDLYILDGKSWNHLSQQQLFSPASGVPNAHRTISLSGGPLSSAPRDPSLTEVSNIDATTFKGFIRLDLSGADFGHRDYAPSLTKQVLSSTISHALPAAGFANAPYTPAIKEISLDYSSTVTIGFSENTATAFGRRVERFFHLEPFGAAERHPFLFISPTPHSLLPQFADEGNLYIGLKELRTPQIVSILFKVAEGSANPDREKQTVRWSYLRNNQWVEFPVLNILSDGTSGLLATGVISFDIPSEIANDNTILPAGTYWLRATVTDFSDAVCELVDVVAQAATATFSDSGNDPEHLRLPLPAGTITKFRESNPKVPKLAQPYASFGGKVKEQSTDFYIRVSERLRHKKRASTIWDYEHLVLEKFPSVYKVKCISHTEDKPAIYSELAAGHVTLIAVSNLRNKNAVNPLQPKTSLLMLEEIRDYVGSLTTCWAEVDVRNPIFEELQVTFSVRFRPGYDNGFYGQKLNEDIKRFLSPWAYDPGKDIAFGGHIHRSMILNYIEEQEYVDFVTCFRMDHLTPDEIFADVEAASPRTAASVLVSAAQHFITVLETDDCGCSDNVQSDAIGPAEENTCDVPTPLPPRRGVGAEAVGSFIVGLTPSNSGINAFQIETDFRID